MKTCTKKYSVWIVDDEAGMCHGVKAALSGFTATLDDLGETVAFQTESFNTGEDFLATLPQRKPDILLLDNKLPGIEGIDILHELSEKRIPLLTIMITAYATIDKAVLATKLGAYDFLAKPFTPDELRYSLRKACATLILKERARKLEEEKRSVRFEFISVLAHELKSPLNVIEGYINMMVSREAGPSLEGYDHMLERTKIRIGLLRKLIADLLDLTSIESGRKIRTLESLDLKDIAAGAVEGCAGQAREKKITVDIQVLCDPVYPADRSEMEMLFTNFITNGIKYNKEDGRLTVTLKKDGQSILISFTDTGIGLSDEDKNKLFKEFSRIKNPKTRDIPGSGLGLSIAKKIVTLYGGEITIESSEDAGSTFLVTLPLTPL